jgi:hypothetical protein
MANNQFLESFENELFKLWERDHFEPLKEFVKDTVVKSYKNGIARGKREGGVSSSAALQK